MPAGKPKRPKEERAVEEFLLAASTSASALFIEGEPGIGKTTLWSAAQEQARKKGFDVWSARASTAESIQAYTALADLLGAVDPQLWSDLPAPQRTALDQIVARTRLPGAATDQRAVAAAFLSVVTLLSADRPLLLAIDDMQCLDQSSVHVLAYAARRLSGPVGFLNTLRTTDEDTDHGGWLQLHRPDAVYRITVRPLTQRALQAVVMDHLGRGISRAAVARIHQISGGNPFYAIELARTYDGSIESLLPSSLVDLVSARIEGLEPDVHEPLLAAAMVAAPTVEVVSAASSAEPGRVVELLEIAEHHGIIAIEGNRIGFTHPLLASGMYTEATPEQRKQMHRRLADVVDEPEQRARHLALATTRGDAETLTALDEAAANAHARGAPAAAAELLDLAMSLGGDTDERRIRLAGHCFDSGEPARARNLLEQTVAGMPAGPARADALHRLAVVRFMDDGYIEASQLLRQALREESGDDPALRVKVMSALGHSLYNAGEPDAALVHTEEAVALAEQIDNPALLSQALAVRATLHFLRGDGMDEASLNRALELEDTELPTPTVLQPSVLYALQSGWVGELDAAYERMKSIQRRCIERGNEGDLVFIDFQVVLNRIWRGDFAEARRVTEDAMVLTRQLGGEFPIMLGLLLRACVAAYSATDDDARPTIAEAIDASKRSGSGWHEDWAFTLLGFLEVSQQNYQAAVSALEPLIARFAQMPNNAEIFAASFVPDAVEALVEVDRADEADKLTKSLERNGGRLNRSWMLAVGARCRAHVLAGRGQFGAAIEAAQAAMVHHESLPMPFERARTQLLLGRLQQRQGVKAGHMTVRTALAVFEQLGVPLWVRRARALLTTDDNRAAATEGLSDSERRVAELAATGMTNRDVAEALFISAKTVEAALVRVYRKLGIRSRAELGRAMGNSDSQRV